MEEDTSSFSPSRQSAHPYPPTASSARERYTPAVTTLPGASSSARPTHVPSYRDSLPVAGHPLQLQLSSREAVPPSSTTLSGTTHSRGNSSLQRTSSSPGAYTLAGPPSILDASISSSSPNLQTSSRYLAERKRRLSSLASSPERQPSRRVTATSSELLRDSLIRRSITNPSSSYNFGSDSTSPDRTYRFNMSTAVASASSSAPINEGQRRSPSTLNHPVLIDLTADEDPLNQADSSSRPSTDNRNDGRGVSRGGPGYPVEEIVLPTWQPDSEVTNCPVCGTKFTWYFRKHHCRKCGRVVCNNCSPHRITIPRQFIVKAPTTIDLTGDDDGSPVPDNIWGGAEVRVCNPCVPDPNFSPPGQPNSPHQQHSSGQMPGWFPYPYDGRPNHASQGGNRASMMGTGNIHSNPSYPGYGYQGQLPPLPGQQIIHQNQQEPFPQFQFRNPSSVRDLWPPTAPPHPGSVMFPPGSSHHHHHHQPQAPLQTQPRQNPLSYAFRSLPLNPFPWASGTDSDSQSGSSPGSPQQHHGSTRPPRREIPEEDECPVCGEELPPKGPNEATTDREAHIEDCIRNRSYGANLPAQSTPPNRPGDISTPIGSFPSSSSRRRLTGAGRMLKYKATEKDCMDEDAGGRQECIICFEEFEVGDMMGRLECLCKFHHECIRQWWETRGDGSCPTHQLHE